MKEPFLFSIIMPSFNQASFIEQSILSVLEQGYGAIEFLVVDGGSSDSTPSILNKFSSRISRIISDPDSGQADAINKGLRRATGEILGWINSDDILYPGVVSLVADIFKAHPDVGVIYGNVDYGANESSIDRTIRGESFDFLDSFRRLHIPMPQQGCFWRRSAMIQCGLLHERWHYVLDRDFFIRLADKERCLYVNHTFGLFRSHPHSKSSFFATCWIQELEDLYSGYFVENSFEHNIFPFRNEVLAASSFAGLLIALRSGLPFVALRLALLVVRRDPLFVFRPYFLSRINQFLIRASSFAF